MLFCCFFPSYYRFDKDVIREILGKKMSAKLRKDMDDVSEKTGIPLKRCRRQVALFNVYPQLHIALCAAGFIDFNES